MPKAEQVTGADWTKPEDQVPPVAEIHEGLWARPEVSGWLRRDFFITPDGKVFMTEPIGIIHARDGHTSFQYEMKRMPTYWRRQRDVPAVE